MGRLGERWDEWVDKYNAPDREIEEEEDDEDSGGVVAWLGYIAVALALLGVLHLVGLHDLAWAAKAVASLLVGVALLIKRLRKHRREEAADRFRDKVSDADTRHRAFAPR